MDLGTFDPEIWQAADKAIAQRYSDLFGWYRDAMAEAHFSGLIRPVHPEFYARQDDAAAAKAESAFTKTVLRIDPFLELWKPSSPRRDGLAAQTGIDPVDASSWRAFLEKIFAMAEAGGCVGIKQLQAYMRPLAFPPREDAEIRWRGDLDKDQRHAFGDWVVHACCALAHDRGWPHQVHVGTHNLDESNPLPLSLLARRYPNQKLVLLHTWPFSEEAGWLAKHRPNVYLDTCWTPILNPQFFRHAILTWINYLPAHKIMCSHDATSVEMAVGSSCFTRGILGEILAAQGAALGLNDEVLLEIAQALLHGNAQAVYRL